MSTGNEDESWVWRPVDFYFRLWFHPRNSMMSDWTFTTPTKFFLGYQDGFLTILQSYFREVLTVGHQMATMSWTIPMSINWTYRLRKLLLMFQRCTTLITSFWAIIIKVKFGLKFLVFNLICFFKRKFVESTTNSWMVFGTQHLTEFF